MNKIEEFKAFCTEKNKEITYGIQLINSSRNRIARIKTCNYNDICSVTDCCCNGGNKNYIKIIKEI